MEYPHVVIINGPSGSGKTTLQEAILAARPDAARLVSTTTRSPRPGEIDGVHYHFFGYEEWPDDPARRAQAFDEAAAAGAFVEQVTRGPIRYGIAYSAIQDLRDDGRLPIVILDLEGTRHFSERMPTLRLAIRVPDDVLHERITEGRPLEEVAERLKAIEADTAGPEDADVFLTNLPGKLEDTVAEALAVLAERAPPPTTVSTPARRSAR